MRTSSGRRNQSRRKNLVPIGEAAICLPLPLASQYVAALQASRAASRTLAGGAMWKGVLPWIAPLVGSR
jgi:hypothetical protein